MGSAWSPDMTTTGVIPSVMDELFSRVDGTTNTDFTVKVSFVEIHKVGSCPAQHASSVQRYAQLLIMPMICTAAYHASTHLELLTFSSVQYFLPACCQCKSFNGTRLHHTCSMAVQGQVALALMSSCV
jgi:hypothetical protein